MPAYVISEVLTTDHDAIARYKSLAAQAAAAHGGRYLARDALPHAIEGSFAPDERVVILEFDTVAGARVWYASEEYQRALTAASGGLNRRLFVIDGNTTTPTT